MTALTSAHPEPEASRPRMWHGFNRQLRAAASAWARRPIAQLPRRQNRAPS